MGAARRRCSSSSSSPTAPTPSCATPRGSSPWRSPSSSSWSRRALLALRGAGRLGGGVAAGFAALAVVVLAIGYPVQRHYLRDRFLNDGPAEERIPGMGLDSAYRWARDIEDARIGLAGTTAGFLQYGFYGTDLSNRVVYLGEKGPHGAFNAIPTCRGFRAAVNAADLDYLVTSPFLDFIDTEQADRLTGGGLAARRAGRCDRSSRSGPVTVWKVVGELDPAACRAPLNAPLRRVPQQPGAERRLGRFDVGAEDGREAVRADGPRPPLPVDSRRRTW